MKFSHICAALLSCFLLAGCSGHAHDERGDHEGHESHEGHSHDATLSLTAYSADYEVFIDADPLVAGHEGHLIIHVTSLQDFHPVTKGAVSLSLDCAGKNVSASLDTPTRPGTYIYELTPPAPGTATLTVTMASSQKVVFQGLTVYSDEHEAHEAAEASHPSHPNGISFSKEQSWNTDFATTIVTTQPLGNNVRVMALVQPTPLGQRTLCATTAGRVIILDSRLAPGEKVAAGNAMFRVDATGMAEGDLKVRLLEAQAEYDRANKEYNRLKSLAAEKLTTTAELNRAHAELESASIILQALRKNFAGGTQTVSSPISGYVQEVTVTDGQYVELGAPLATVSSSASVQLTAKVPVRYASQLANISDALIIRGGEPVSINGMGGRFVSRGSMVEPGTPMLPIVMEMRNELHLIPGSYVETLLRFGGGREVLAVPRSAIVEEMGNTFVMVQITPEYFEKRQVTLGQSDGAFYEVLSGLKAGERIVSRGAPIVKLSQSAGALDAHAGHAH